MKPTAEQWAKYETDLKAHHERMQAKKPKPETFGYQSSASPEEESGWLIEGGEEAYSSAMSAWDMELHCDAPNKPGYEFANND